MWVRLLQGTPPSVHTAIELYNVLSMSDTASLRQPVGLEQQLLKDNDMDSEVGQSMLQLLKVMSVTATLLLQAPIKSEQTVVTVMQLIALTHRTTLPCRMCIQHHSTAGTLQGQCRHTPMSKCLAHAASYCSSPAESTMHL